MTMQNAPHPDDERLAAYAGGDADAVSDRALAEHLTACDRCLPIIQELSLLRGALAALPDLAPSRPLRLVPPVPAPAARRVGPLEWLRRAAAPAMAVGAGLALVGAVGASGLAEALGGADAGRTSVQEANASENAPVPVAGAGLPTFSPLTAPDGSFADKSGDSLDHSPSAEASGAPAAGSGKGPDDALATPSPRDQPWLTLLIVGVTLFGISTVLRFSVSPRGG